MTPLKNHCREYLGASKGGFCKEPATEELDGTPLCAIHEVMRRKQLLKIYGGGR